MFTTLGSTPSDAIVATVSHIDIFIARGRALERAPPKEVVAYEQGGDLEKHKSVGDYEETCF